MIGRRVRDDVVPKEGEQGGDQGRHVEGPHPAQGFHENAGHRPGDHCAEGAAEQGRDEFSLLVRWRPARDDVVEGGVDDTLYLIW